MFVNHFCKKRKRDDEDPNKSPTKKQKLDVLELIQEESTGGYKRISKHNRKNSYRKKNGGLLKDTGLEICK